MKVPMHRYRQDLVRLVSEGSSMDELLKYFTARMSLGETFHLFRDAGLMTPLRTVDDINEQRRRELQDLSLT
jgi:hypothetical protein